MNQLINLFIKRLSLLGKVPLCNGIPSRAPQIFGYCFPLCYRCIGIIVTFLAVFYWSYRKHKQSSWVYIVLLAIPMIIDGGIQTFLGIESHNIRRLITGSLFGCGLGLCITRLFLEVDKNIERKLKL